MSQESNDITDTKTDNRQERFMFSSPPDLSVNFSKLQLFFLGLQNTLGMSGVIIIPIIVGMNVSVTMFCAGIGTLIYQFIDKGMIPAFLGGSFAFIAPLTLIIKEMGIPYAQGGVIFVMCFYFIFALALRLLGPQKVAMTFPPIITGPIIMILGLSLAGVGVTSASSNWVVALLTFALAIAVNVVSKGLTKILTIIIALVGGYIISIPFGIVDFSGVIAAPWFGVPDFSFPKFDLRAVIAIAPAAIVPCIEHIGDVIALGNTVGKDFTKDPGLPRSLFACGCATAFSGLLGGPSLTIHSENTGVLAITRIYSPFVVRCGAFWMALFSFTPKFEALCRSIPNAVLGGVGILLYGMITCVGMRTIVESRTDLSIAKNLVVASSILILGVGGAKFVFPGDIQLGGMAISAVAGIILNLVLPDGNR
jgi:uracil permease